MMETKKVRVNRNSVIAIAKGGAVGLLLIPFGFAIKQAQVRASEFQEKHGFPESKGAPLQLIRDLRPGEALHPSLVYSLERSIMEGDASESNFAINSLMSLAKSNPGTAQPILSKLLEKIPDKERAMRIALTAGAMKPEYQSQFQTAISLRRDDLKTAMRERLDEVHAEVQARRKQREQAKP